MLLEVHLSPRQNGNNWIVNRGREEMIERTQNKHLDIFRIVNSFIGSIPKSKTDTHIVSCGQILFNSKALGEFATKPHDLLVA